MHFHLNRRPAGTSLLLHSRHEPRDVFERLALDERQRGHLLTAPLDDGPDPLNRNIPAPKRRGEVHPAFTLESVALGADLLKELGPVGGV